MSPARALCFLMIVVRWHTVGQTTLPQRIYQAEEHKNVTLECPYPNTDMAPHTLIKDLNKENPLERICRYDSRREPKLYINELYKGRLLCDPQLIKNGSICFVLTDLRLNDTGTYRCVVVVANKTTTEVLQLVVTASRNQTVTNTSQPASRGRTDLYKCNFSA
ncbi:programmed cell death 1 ligand 1-like isoform X2 [Melanotaenia boesemani]|uniref:programmed cell death 1 ligand 1-like isoform X2 n=1 Tax=Melanotaenia boesemani TaxID=1250792 RepID=UPI001C048128|nr:programmed cell death 1 ligand 1-like isoform X2 [Melanotaenia boesemani]